MKKVFFCLVFLFAFSEVEAQTNCSYSLTIKVIDEQSKSALPGVVVQLNNVSMSKESDAKGVVVFE